MKICFIIGSPDIGGGTYVIYQHALFLQNSLGHLVHIIPIFAATPENTAWHTEASTDLTFRSFPEAAGEQYDVAILTWWKTVFEAEKINALRYIYFVQSIESWFYPEKEKPLRKLVDATYTLALPVITEANWIKNYLYCEYSSVVCLARNGIRKDIYKPYGAAVTNRTDGKLRLLVEGPIDVDFKNVPRTISLCRKSMADEVWLLTSSAIQTYPGIDRVFSRVNVQETPAIYRSCDVLVKLSYVEGMFGPPLEMFHCGGTTIVYDVTGHDEYIHNRINGFVAKKGDEQTVLNSINALKKDSVLLNAVKTEALRTAMDWPDWDTSSRIFAQAISGILASTPPMKREEFFKKCHEIFGTYVEEENAFKSSGIAVN